MVEGIEELTFDAECDPLLDGKLLGQIQIAPGEARSMQREALRCTLKAILEFRNGNRNEE
jgi:hypothetical protein